MKVKFCLLLTANILLAACHSNTYKINGHGDDLEPGDTLYLTTDLMGGIPSDTIIVDDEGNFSYENKADSTCIAMIYNARRNEINVNFFIEPGDIDITMSSTPGASRVSGTKCNDEWQVLTDSVMAIGMRINHIAERIYGKVATEEEQRQGVEQIDVLNRHFADVVIKTAERNIDNEFGYFLVTFYPEEIIDNETRAKLFEQLPKEMRQRQEIKDWEVLLGKSAETAEGAMLPDFAQPAPDGTMIHIKDEVAKNRLTIIDFWASWCGPCRQDIPYMIELYNEFHPKGLGIVGVSLDNDHDAWTTAIDKLGMPWPQMSDLKYWDNAAAKMFNISSIPHTVIVDQQGKILRRGLRGDALYQFVADQLK